MNRPRRWVGRFASLLAGATLLVAACTAPRDGATAEGDKASAARGAPVLAFVRPLAREIVLADADGRTWRGVRLRAAPDHVRWSPDGSALAWIDDESDSHGGRILHRLDVTTGRERTTPCACGGVGFLGDEVATLSSDGDALLFLAADGQTRRAALSEPLGDYARVAAGGRDQVTIADLLPEREVGRGQYRLVGADRSGTVRPFLPARAPTSFADGIGSPDGRRIAWASADSGGACWNVGNVLLATYGDKGRQTPERPVDAVMGHALLEERVLVTGLAWAGEGLTVTFGPMTGCQAAPPERFVSYYQHDGAWRFIGTGMSAVGYGAGGRGARLLVPERPERREEDDSYLPLLGDLEFSDGRGERHVLGSGVSAFVFTPAESAKAAPPARVAQPKDDRVARTTDRGEPVPTHLRALAEGIKDAAEDGDVARLRSLCDHCDGETKDAVRTAEGRRELVRLLSSHPGRTENGIVFPGLAAHRCVDEPEQDITCTAEQLRDIALLDIPVVGGIDDAYEGQVYEAESDHRLQLRSGSGGKALWVGRYLP
ncbi:TolB family protein [Streptomyces sp. NPDC088755]|uniref:TolB family protein n=1 Tax=Streptomyces sp. NPDC088755 TaxID=3365888 RepID=UPI0037F44018